MKNEQRYLAGQAADAKIAMLQTVQELKHTLTQVTDLPACAQRHPWIATGAAVAGGFVAGLASAGPRSDPGEKRRAGADVSTALDFSPREPIPQESGFVRGAVGIALSRIFQTAVQSLIAAAVEPCDVTSSEKRRHQSGSVTAVFPEHAQS